MAAMRRIKYPFFLWGEERGCPLPFSLAPHRAALPSAPPLDIHPACHAAEDTPESVPRPFNIIGIMRSTPVTN